MVDVGHSCALHFVHLEASLCQVEVRTYTPCCLVARIPFIPSSQSLQVKEFVPYLPRHKVLLEVTATHGRVNSAAKEDCSAHFGKAKKDLQIVAGSGIVTLEGRRWEGWWWCGVVCVCGKGGEEEFRRLSCARVSPSHTR